MKVIFQNSEVETAASTLAAFLSERQIDGARAIVEYAGEVYPAGADLAAVELRPGAPIEVFKIMAGG